MFIALNCMHVVVAAMLGAIMITRLHAMYQCRNMLIFLFIIFLGITIAKCLANAMSLRQLTSDLYVLSGTYQCIFYEGDNATFYFPIYWAFTTLWEVLAMGLAIWIAVKRFRELRRISAGGFIGDCFTVLMQSHLVYFASFVAVSCISFSSLAPAISMDNPWSLRVEMYYGFLQVVSLVQSFVLGPRLILSIRKYHAKLVADSDAATGMSSIAFQEHVHVSTSSSV